MSSHVDWSSLSVRVRARRGDRSLREVARDLPGISVATLSRCENGAPVDLATLLSLCDWLEASPQEFITSRKMRMSQIAPLDQMEILLRAAGYPDAFVDALLHLLKLLASKERENR